MKTQPKQIGASYVEVLVAVALIAISLTPIMDALYGSVTGIDQHRSLVQQRLQLIAKLEETLATPFGTLEAESLAAGSETTPTGLSDAIGATDRRLVFLSLYDIDNADSDSNPFTGGEAGLMWIRVEMEGTAHVQESLVSQQ